MRKKALKELAKRENTQSQEKNEKNVKKESYGRAIIMIFSGSLAFSYFSFVTSNILLGLIVGGPFMLMGSIMIAKVTGAKKAEEKLTN